MSVQDGGTTADPTAAAAVLTEVEDIAAAAGGTIEVTVLDADGKALLSSADASTPVYTASLVKLLVVHQILLQAETGTLVLTSADLQLMQAAIEASDDDAMNQLWVDFDGDALVDSAVETFGLTGTAPPADAGQWGQTTTTAADYATVLATYADTLTDADGDLLTGWLQSTTSTAADGFDQDFGLLSLDLDQVAAKQGWMCCLDDTRWLHSTGVLADGTVLVLLGTFPESTSWAQAGEALDAAAAATIGGT
ncbi:hypothetical protein [Klenkia soli]|uniref:hypothetical protein n=1 Tax=Klenkia soli TaxID=1052260 RepID=UPI000B837E88|nr:hypothetical protein [Klenkia soli]